MKRVILYLVFLVSGCSTLTDNRSQGLTLDVNKVYTPKAVTLRKTLSGHTAIKEDINSFGGLGYFLIDVVNSCKKGLPKNVVFVTPRNKCCRVCKTGKACGDSCISKDKVCSKPTGCACDSSK